MNEADTRAEPIEPALRAAGWGAVEGSLICREVIAPGRLQGGGRRSSHFLATRTVNMTVFNLSVDKIWRGAYVAS